MKPSENIVLNGRPSEASPGFQVTDLYYILLRHKWKILGCFVAGVAAAGVLFVTKKPIYTSEARLLILYVLENRSLGLADRDSQIKSPESRGDSIINSEREILTSLDLAKEVASLVGPTNLVGGKVEGDPLIAAAAALRNGLEVEVPHNNNILHVRFRHLDPLVARSVLTNLVPSYLKMHARVHRSMDNLDELARQTDQRRASLEQVETELRRLKAEVGVVSLEDSQKAYSDQLNKTRSDMLETEALLAEARAALGQLTNTVAAVPVVAPSSATNAIPPGKLSAYKRVVAQIDGLSHREQVLLDQFTAESPFVRTVRDQLTVAETERQRLEQENPGLTGVAASLNRSEHTPATDAPALAASRVSALEAKLQTLTNQLDRIRGEALKVDGKEAEITQLERKKALDEKQYFYYSTSLEQARVDEAVGPGKMANISVIQSPSPAIYDNPKFFKQLAGVVGGGLALGLAWALALEFYVDQSVRRPGQIERQLRLPLFLSIPILRPPPAVKRQLPALAASNSDTPPGPAIGNGAPTDNPIDLYAEALRDRLIMHFQLRELHHKPKLVGVTSCNRGAGVTTVASNLAASLSEIGEGNVLYVDVNLDRGPTIHPFHGGRPTVGISQALDHETRGLARVQENLYMVNLTEPDGKKVGVLPKKLAGLVPQIKASDYDYIIFDLPAITQTSATAKLAGLLDMTFVVLESEKTQSDLAKQATGLLTEARADVALILNKHHRYLPRRVDTDL